MAKKMPNFTPLCRPFSCQFESFLFLRFLILRVCEEKCECAGRHSSFSLARRLQSAVFTFFVNYNNNKAWGKGCKVPTALFCTSRAVKINYELIIIWCSESLGQSLFLILSTNKENRCVNKWCDLTNCNYQQLSPRQLHPNCLPWASAWVTQGSSTPKSSRVCTNTQDIIFCKVMRKILESWCLYVIPSFTTRKSAWTCTLLFGNHKSRV